MSDKMVLQAIFKGHSCMVPVDITCKCRANIVGKIKILGRYVGGYQLHLDLMLVGTMKKIAQYVMNGNERMLRPIAGHQNFRNIFESFACIKLDECKKVFML